MRGIPEKPKIKKTDRRAFLALFASDEIRKYCRDVLRALDKEKRNLRVVPQDQLHVTLRFLGASVSEHSLKLLAEELIRHRGSYARPVLEVGKAQLGFPRQKYPTAIFLSVKETPELDILWKQVHAYIKDVNASDTIVWKQPEEGTYHITIARLKPAAVTRSTIARIKELVDAINTPRPQPQQLEMMHLVTSRPSKDGTPLYQKVADILL